MPGGSTPKSGIVFGVRGREFPETSCFRLRKSVVFGRSTGGILGELGIDRADFPAVTLGPIGGLRVSDSLVDRSFRSEPKLLLGNVGNREPSQDLSNTG